MSFQFVHFDLEACIGQKIIVGIVKVKEEAQHKYDDAIASGNGNSRISSRM